MSLFHESGSASTRGALPVAHRLFLLSYDPARARLDDDSAAVRGSLLRAAAVAELRLTGLVRDTAGRAERTGASPATPLDPFLAGVLGDVARDRPRSWFDLLRTRSHEAEETVRDQLVAAGAVTVERSRILGLFPTRRIGLADPGLVQALRDRAHEAVHADASAVHVEEALLVVLAIDGNVSTLFGWRAQREHKAAVRALARRIDRELPGLRRALSASMAVDRAG